MSKLEYIDTDKKADHGRFLRFVDRSLLLSTAPVLESLHFKFDRQCSDVDTIFWIKIAVERGLRELNFDNTNKPCRLPQSLFTCGTLVVLKLTSVSLVDVKFPVKFQLLKTLHLCRVIFSDNESPRKLLSTCQILEVLVVKRAEYDKVTIFSIPVPSLQKLTYDARPVLYNGESEFVLYAPSWKCLEISDFSYECMVERMPELVAANVEGLYWNTGNILSSLTSVKRLSLCLPAEVN